MSNPLELSFQLSRGLDYDMIRIHPDSSWGYCSNYIIRTYNHTIGSFRIPTRKSWKPSPDSVLFLSNENFTDVTRNLGGDYLVNLLTQIQSPIYTTRENRPRIMINVEQIEDFRELQILLAEEFLHARGLQTPINFDESAIPIGNGINLGNEAMEKFVSMLAYYALGVFKSDYSSIPESLSGQAHNNKIIFDIINRVPNCLDQIVKLCIDGQNPNLNRLLDSHFLALYTEDGLSPHGQIYLMAALLHTFETQHGESTELIVENLLRTLMSKILHT